MAYSEYFVYQQDAAPAHRARETVDSRVAEKKSRHKTAPGDSPDGSTDNSYYGYYFQLAH